MVAEYTVDELANDSEDEKRLKKAEWLAERKASKCKKKRVVPSSAKQTARFTAPKAAMTAGPSGYHVPRRWPTMPPPQLFRVSGSCFVCGEMGHIMSHCPKTATSTAVDPRKWYPVSDVANHALGGVVGNMCAERESDNVAGDNVELIEMGQKQVLVSEGLVEPEDVCAWEVEVQDVNVTTRVKGRLKEKLSFWKDELKVSAFIS